MIGTQPDVRSTPWRWIAVIWLAGALFDASQTVFIMHAEGRHRPWAPLFGIELASWLPWALATPLVIQLARRRPIRRGMSTGVIMVHLAAFATISAVAEAWNALLQVIFNPWGNRHWPTFLDTWSTTLLFQILTFVITYALIVTITFVVDARASVAQAQLQALRRQMEPHFMYNTLNSIAGLVRDNRNDAAVSMVVGLSEFLRRASEDSHRPQVTLQEEVEYLQRYLEIQQVRFGERLRVLVDIPQELLRAEVPNLLLQPLVENAIKHGIAKRVNGGTVRVAGVRQDSTLCLSIYNDGPGLSTAKSTGVGIDNLRTRLQILHGYKSELQLRSAEPDGVEVVVKLPFREA
jgi:two-component system LytT family sensor kinase